MSFSPGPQVQNAPCCKDVACLVKRVKRRPTLSRLRLRRRRYRVSRLWSKSSKAMRFRTVPPLRSTTIAPGDPCDPFRQNAQLSKKAGGTGPATEQTRCALRMQGLDVWSLSAKHDPEHGTLTAKKSNSIQKEAGPLQCHCKSSHSTPAQRMCRDGYPGRQRDSMMQHLCQHARGVDATLQHTSRRLGVKCAGLQASLAAAWPQHSLTARSTCLPSSAPASNQQRQLRVPSSCTRAEHAPDVSGPEWLKPWTASDLKVEQSTSISCYFTSMKVHFICSCPMPGAIESNSGNRPARCRAHGKLELADFHTICS